MNAEAMAAHQGEFSKGTHPHADTWAFPPGGPESAPEHPHMDDDACMEHCLTPDEGKFFDDNGFLHVKGALSSELVGRLLVAGDRANAWAREQKGMAPDEDRLNLLDFIGLDDAFLELLDHPTTFPKVWGLMGWHISLYHSHMIYTPPAPPPAEPPAPLSAQGGWHQDSGRLNNDLEGSPRPRVSMKVGYFLTDATSEGTGFQVIPGSHKYNLLNADGSSTIVEPADGSPTPMDAISVQVKAGDAVFFDRRVWHNGSAQPYLPDGMRKVLFYGYGYRWLRPRDNMTVAHYMERSGPIRRQLLGAATGGQGYTSPSDADVPLRAWILDRMDKEAVRKCTEQFMPLTSAARL